jgi:DNA polymerase-3 subunit beta
VEKRTGEELKIKGIILPRRAVAEIGGLWRAGRDRWMSGSGKGPVSSATRGIFSGFILIHAEYPDYERVISRGGGMKIFLKRDIISSSLKRMNVVSSETFTGVVLNVAGGKLKTQLHESGRREADEEMEIDYGGKDFSITYNVRYLIDAIEGVDDEGNCFRNTRGNRSGSDFGEGRPKLPGHHHALERVRNRIV